MAIDPTEICERPVYKAADLARWPRQMRAETAAAYCDEVSTTAFLRSVPMLYPEPRQIPGKGKRWLREDLDLAIDRIHGRTDERSPALRDLV